MEDDVDRLFQCFKCGVSPPQSAFRQRKKRQHSVKANDSAQAASTSCSITSSSPAGESHRDSPETQPSIQNPFPSAAITTNLNTKKQFSPIVFYGSPHGVPPKRPARLLRLLHEIRVDLSEKNKLREDIWATFPRQDEAIKYAKEHCKSHVFCYQDHANGQRRYLVSTYQEFWERYKQMNPKFRHHYEVIQEFSRHLILRLPKTAFKDNSHAGAFVAEVCSRIHKSRETEERFKNLFVSKDSSETNCQCQLFVDNAVYSRNRCFRLPLSSKAGKSSVLLPSGRFKCKDMSEEEVFMASLICSMDDDCEKLLICKMDTDCVKSLRFDSETSIKFDKHSNLAQEFDWNACTIDASRTYMMGKSPFPSFDVFIENVASIGNKSGKIRSWYWFSEYGLMIYSMSRNRYCERIGRQHKSNHVMYVVDIRRGNYYQKCHDPDCRGYRSPLRPVPNGVIPDPGVFLHLSGQTEVPVDTASTADQSLMDSCKKEWWTEAIRLADQVESIQRTLDLTGMQAEKWEEDDDWWRAVERTASQTESKYSSQA
nr:DNA-directed primase/polymerase protein-like isoform X3 [Coffea arabica]